MGKSEKQSLNNWINNYGTVSKWFQKYKNIVQLVNKNGIVKISNFLPDFIADGILNTLENLPSNYWNETSAS